MNFQKGNILLPLISIIAIVAVVFAGYFYWQTQQLANKNATSITDTHVGEEFNEVKDKEKIEWKTYTNSNPTYTIKYPSDWIIDSSKALSDSGSVLLISKDGHALKIYMPTGFGPGVCLFNDSPDFNKEMEGPFGKCPGDFTEFNGIETVYRRLDTPTFIDGIASWSVYTKDPSDNWVTVPIISYSAPQEFNKDLVKTLDEITSTLKFTN